MTDYRGALIAAAAADIGPDTHEKRIRIWSSALGRMVAYPEIAKLAWCGGATLCWLHDAGLALDVHWRIGAGFILQQPHPLPVTRHPLPGDIGYQGSPFQHHFVVTEVDGDTVHSIDANQPDVKRKTRVITPSLTFYSIQPFLDAVGSGVHLPNPGVQLQRHLILADYQHAINTLMLKHSLDHALGLLTVDGILGPRTEEALKWAQKTLGVPVTGYADAETAKALGLS